MGLLHMGRIQSKITYFIH